MWGRANHEDTVAWGAVLPDGKSPSPRYVLSALCGCFPQLPLTCRNTSIRHTSFLSLCIAMFKGLAPAGLPGLNGIAERGDGAAKWMAE